MSFADPNKLTDDVFGEPEQHLAIRLWDWLVITWRPTMGWTILGCTLLLTTLPMQAASINEWITLGPYGSTMVPIGPLGVLYVWVVMGWRRDRGHNWYQPNPRLSTIASRRIRFAMLLFLVTSIGLIVVSQILVGWVPGPVRILQAIRGGGFSFLFAESSAELANIGTRLVRWWAGVLAGGATQDNLVFASFAGAIAWFNGIVTGYLVRRHYSGLLSGVPSLWLLLATMLYGSIGRMIFVTGLLVTLLLHVLMDQHRLSKEWDRHEVSYGDGLILDRMIAVLAASVLIFGLASMMPNLHFSGLANRYLELYQPLNQQVEGFGQRLFPDMKVTSRFRGMALSDGLPNSFLLGSGPELSETEVMRYRTDESYVFEPEILEEVPVTGHYIRGGSLSIYDGAGWSNPLAIERLPIEADRFVPNLHLLETLSLVDSSPEIPRGRRLLTQDIFLRFNSRGLYGAAEPISFSLNYRLDRRHPGDQTSFAVDGSDGGPAGASSYTVVSAIPNVNEAALAVERAFFPDDEDPLWDVLSHHLTLPDSITDRTRALARELTADLESPYAKAVSIESYLREFEYDLSVTAPPDDVEDVADYFLFELQRGYCDYYATAFIILARLSGLPARFSTGFVPGTWNGAEQMWVVTEAEAHSWPEVYFPSYGWIPFEPTAGRSALFRSGVGPESAAPISTEIRDVPIASVSTEPDTTWNWQMLIWLLPVGGLLWVGYALWGWWHRNRQDPWLSILRWGQRIGRPIQPGETVLEYGRALGDFVLDKYRHRNQDVGRTVARELSTLSEQLTTAQYATTDQRLSAQQYIDDRWKLLRSYMASL